MCAILICCVNLSYAQSPIEIGKVENEKFMITADTLRLRKAIESVLNDGTHISSMHIESVNKWHYLIAEGKQSYYNKLIAIELNYNITSRTFWATENLGHKTCASAACYNCAAYKENGNIIGCHCIEQRTLSNECTYKHETKSTFYKQLTHYIKLKPSSK